MPEQYCDHCIGCPYENAKQLPETDQQIRKRPLSMEDNGAITLLIFQSPGIEEWKTGIPISSKQPGSAGFKLDRAFGMIRKDRMDFDITNAVQCFPGKGTNTTAEKPRDKNPPTQVINHCSQWLKLNIEAKNLNNTNRYKLIVVFGAPATKAVYELGYKKDPRFRFVPHPTSAGMSYERLAQAIDDPPSPT